MFKLHLLLQLVILALDSNDLSGTLPSSWGGLTQASHPCEHCIQALALHFVLANPSLCYKGSSPIIDLLMTSRMSAQDAEEDVTPRSCSCNSVHDALYASSSGLTHIQDNSSLLSRFAYCNMLMRQAG